MNKHEYSKIIHDTHKAVSSSYGDLDIHGQIAKNNLSHWNYTRNVEQPISHIVNHYLPWKSFSMLDAGCGNGQLFHLYTSIGAKVIYGIDFGIQMLLEACHRADINRIRFFPINGKLENLPFANDSFQLINLYGVLEHLPEPIKVLRELERIIVPGGILIVSVPRKGSLAWLTYGLFCPSLHSVVMKETFFERIKFSRKRKMKLYRFYSKAAVRNLICSLNQMTVLTRIPIAHGGLVGFPAVVLKYLSCQGKYDYIDNWNRFACHIKLIPAGEYIVFKKITNKL
ncbi:MAG: class I SAM-dependent methyltransferase [Pseudomonadota bacterium]|nr:class I SAM-dependent methyltransferase [Pseudomonadota bacterium]